MKKKGTVCIIFGILGLIIFVLYTLFIMRYDVQAIGPKGSKVGLASINLMVREIIGTHKIWYHITEYFGIVAVFTVVAFAITGLVEAIQRKSLLKVDKEIYLLGGFYIVVIACYIVFEKVIINYRPVLEDGKLEASYPSSHTILIMCVMASAFIELKRIMEKGIVRNILLFFIILIMIVTVVGRLICGVHWFSDIVGGMLLSLALIIFYKGLTLKIK